MISDEILYMDREFRDTERGVPTLLLMNPTEYAELREELGISELEEFTRYHGMDIEVSEDFELTVTTPYLLNVSEFIDDDFE